VRVNRPLLAFAIVAVIAVVATIVTLTRHDAIPQRVAFPTPLETPSEPQFIASVPKRESTPAPTPSDKRTRGSHLAGELNAPGFDAQHDVATLHAMLREYLRVLHGQQARALGNDSDLAHALTGHNPMHFVILPPTHPALADGRLRDRWGTPYFIHPRGRGAFEIRSAGPDRKLFTADDVIENPAPSGTDLTSLPIEEPTEQ